MQSRTRLFRRCFWPALGAALGQEVANHHGLIALLVTRGKNERDYAVLLLQLLDLIRQFGPVAQLLAIALLKFGPARGIVPEPFAQGGRRTDLFQPQSHRGAFFGNASRPDAVHQNAAAIRALRGFVNALDLQHTRNCSAQKRKKMGPKEDRLRRRSSGKKGLARGGGSSGHWLPPNYIP